MASWGANPQLRSSLLDDVLDGLKLARKGWARRIVRFLLWPAADRLAKLGENFDQIVRRSGIHAAMQRILPYFVSNFEVMGAEAIPEQGPLLVTSNHPGNYDSLLIAATLPRNDLRIISSGITFLQKLPATSQHLIFATPDVHARMMVVRAAIRHLQAGGALLIYPSGGIDPDPAVMAGAENSIQSWSPSIELMLRKVPHTRVLTTIVSGVLSAKSWRHPFAKFWEPGRERQRAAEVIQMVHQLLDPARNRLSPRISFDCPVSLEDLCTSPAMRTLDAIIERARQLLNYHISLA